MRTTWLRPGDWWHPAVERVAARLDDDGVLGAVEELGAARAEHGVGIGEAIDDVVALFRALGRGVPPLEVVRALCEGWASPAGMPLVPGTVMDPETGLPTLEYLTVRLREEFATVRRRGGDPAAELRVVLVDVARDGTPPWARVARSATVGRAIELALGEGWPCASLGGGLFAILHSSPQTLADDVDRVRAAIQAQARRLGVSDLLRQPPRIWVEHVPADHEAATMRLAAVRRRSRSAGLTAGAATGATARGRPPAGGRAGHGARRGRHRTRRP